MEDKEYIKKKIFQYLIDMGVGEISDSLVRNLVIGYQTEAKEHLSTIEFFFNGRTPPLTDREKDLFILHIVFDHLIEEGGGPEYYPQLDRIETHLEKVWSPESLTLDQKEQLNEIKYVNQRLRSRGHLDASHQ
jgi:hypothetical protein